MTITKFRRILLVDDNPHDIEMTVEALHESNLTNAIDTVSDGEQALDYVFRRGKYADRVPDDPAVILLDIKMPKVDGIEVLGQLKSNPTTQHIPVVMLTSSREEPDLERCYSLGVNAYVVKPVGFPEFIDSIKQLGLFWMVLNEPPRASD